MASDDLGCRRAEELLSDHVEGTLNGVLSAELDQHLAGCPACRELRAALREVIEVLRSRPAVEPAHDLAERSAAAALEHARALRSAALAWRPGPLPRLVQAAAALAMLALGVWTLVAGPEAGPSRLVRRVFERGGSTAIYVAERRDRLVEDIRILRVVIAAAFEGRLDEVSDRFDDYRKLLEKRQAKPAGQKQTGGADKDSNHLRVDLVRRDEADGTPRAPGAPVGRSDRSV
jgi:plasmid stabilization system protein ParE